MSKPWIIAPALVALVAACGETPEIAAPEAAEAAAPAAPEVAETATAENPNRLTGFTYTGDVDHFGYYMPSREVRVGDYRLDHIHMASPSEFAAWERGERSQTYAPVMLHFDDVTSPMVQTELGEAHSRSVRVLPTAYEVGEGNFRFVGSAPEIGEVILDGMLDLDQLAQVRDAGGGSEELVLRTAAQIGPERVGNLSFFWYGGH